MSAATIPDVLQFWALVGVAMGICVWALRKRGR